MIYCKLIVLALLLLCCQRQPKQTYASSVKDLFFRVDINDSYENNLKYYRSLSFLREAEPEGITIYPPLSALKQDSTNYNSFIFFRHPFESSNFGKGRLNIEKYGLDNNALSNLVIYYVFKSKQNAESAYKSLIDRFSKLSSVTKTNQIHDLKWTEFADSASHLPNIRISIDDGDEIINGYAVIISTIR